MNLREKVCTSEVKKFDERRINKQNLSQSKSEKKL